MVRRPLQILGIFGNFFLSAYLKTRKLNLGSKMQIINAN